MSAIQQIHAAIRQADQEHPDYKMINTKATCFALLARTLQLAGDDFAFVGKTATMDGSGQYAPPGFVPFTMAVVRDDGQWQDVTIAGVSMDACWHLPTMKQIKVIVNSTDGEIDEGGSGKPARLDSYEIDEFREDGTRQYRWHNPPVSQERVTGVAPSVPPIESPRPVEPPKPQLKSYEELGDDEGAKQITRILEHDYKKAGRPGLDGDCGGWLRRTDYDVLTGIVPTVAASLTKHRDEWLIALGLIVSGEPGMMSDSLICKICGASVGFERGKPKIVPHAADCVTR